MKKKLLLVYIGNEQGAWGNIAFPRPSHYYVMPGILCCAAALKADNRISESFDVECLYLNATVQTPQEMATAVSSAEPSIAGFSTYLWNKEFVLHCCNHLKKTLPDVPIMLGGPEVSMEKQDEIKRFLAENSCVDLLVFGESENKIASLAISLAGQTDDTLSSVSGYAFSDRLFDGRLDLSSTQGTDFETAPSPFPTEDIRVKRSEHCGLAIVYETTRGCPYRCIYCRFGHRSEKIRSKSLSQVLEELSWLLERKFDCIHFADPVFDMDPDRASQILTFLRDHNKQSSLFFYCSFFRLNRELAQLFEETQCQIGVGVQSTNRNVLTAIRRALAPDLFEDKRALLETYKINFYTDLIFGLPQDNLESFRRSVTETLNLNPSFMMLFPLTLIKGTPLEQNASNLMMRTMVDDELKSLNLMCDIEYRNIALFKDFSAADLEIFDSIALTCFYFYNRFRYSLRHLEKRSQDGAALYGRIGSLTKEYLRSIGRKPSNTEDLEGFQDEILRIFHTVLDDLGAGERERDAFDELFKLDIYRIILLSAPNREKIFNAGWNLRTQQSGIAADDSEKRVLPGAYGKTIPIKYSLESLERLHQLKETVRPDSSRVYLFSAFEKWNTGIISETPFLKALTGSISSERPVRYGRLVSMLKQQLKNALNEQEIEEKIENCRKMGIIKLIMNYG